MSYLDTVPVGAVLLSSAHTGSYLGSVDARMASGSPAGRTARECQHG